MPKENSMEKEEIRSRLQEARAILDGCISALSSRRKFGKKVALGKVKKIQTVTKLHFGSNERNFIKTYSHGMSGAKKFTLLLAFLSKGKIGNEVALIEIETAWNRMKAKNLMGYKFNRKYSTEAKTEGWVNSGKHGFYQLLNGWMDILKE